MPRGPMMCWCRYSPRRTPDTSSTMRPTCSMLVPYIHWSPGVEQCGCRQRCQLAGHDRRRPGGLVVAHQIVAPEFVREARGVCQQVTQRDRGACRAHLRPAVGVEALEHAHLPQDAQHVRGRGVELQLAAFDELHGRGSGDGLAHGGDPAHRVGGHRPGGVVIDRPHTGGGRAENIAGCHDLRGGTGHVAVADASVEDRLDSFGQSHRVSSCRRCIRADWHIMQQHRRRRVVVAAMGSPARGSIDAGSGRGRSVSSPHNLSPRFVEVPRRACRDRWRPE